MRKGEKEKSSGEEKGEEHPKARGEAKTSPPFIQCCASWQNYAPILETTRSKTPKVPPHHGGRECVDPPGQTSLGMEMDPSGGESEKAEAENPGGRPGMLLLLVRKEKLQ